MKAVRTQRRMILTRGTAAHDRMPPNYTARMSGWRKRLKRIPLGGIVLVVVSLLAIVVFKAVNFGAGLSHMNVKVLSGSPGGNYSAVVDGLAARAAKRGG